MGNYTVPVGSDWERESKGKVVFQSVSTGRLNVFIWMVVVQYCWMVTQDQLELGSLFLVNYPVPQY